MTTLSEIAKIESDKIHHVTNPNIISYRVPKLIKHEQKKSEDPIEIINDLIYAKNGLVEQIWFINQQLEALYDTT